MKHPLPDLYVTDLTGNEQKIEFSKLRFEFQNGNKVTVEISEHNPDNEQEIALRGYYGDKEYEQSERFLTLHIRPGACNVIGIKPVSHISKKVVY